MGLPIVVDTREQLPYSFQDYGADVTRAALPTGDYSVAGMEGRIAVERKTADDLLRCLTCDRERFAREMERMRDYDSVCVVVELPYNAFSAGWYRSRMAPQAATASVTALMARYRVPFHFAESRRKAEAFVFDFLRFCADGGAARG